ncbi:uncharacterized protein LOC114331466 isoform X1 [Diabrotica virgifera virgifera]|uniref:Gustatory receptor n=1 Tax=Diabrotica virgifera virgifera TaxID=50390 RepID=A0ABM5JW08_DIAVI|nr:uncharacterized protein LOC114331466 isoform X1 [Diabrotica virgifera virgifera]
MQSASNEKKVNSLLKYFSILGITTPYAKCRLSKLYAIFLLFLTLLISCFCNYMKGFHVKALEKYHFVIKITDATSCTILTCGVAVTIINTRLIYVDNINKILQRIKEFDIVVKPNLNCALCVVILFVMHFFLMSTTCFDAYTWSTSESFGEYKYFLIRDIQNIQLSSTICLWMWLGSEIRRRFSVLNDLLIDELIHKDSSSLSGNNKAEKPDLQKMSKKLKNIGRLYNKMCDAVDLVNELFGLSIMFFVIFAICYVVSYSSVLALVAVGSEAMSGLTKNQNLRILSLVWIVENMIKIMALASAGENLSREANRTITVCYGIINTLDNNPQYNVDAIKEELNFLIQQAAHRKPCLSASGFFVANSTMMGFIIGSITSYVIVAVQFLKETSP